MTLRTISEHVDKLVADTGISREHAQSVVELAISDPDRFRINQELIERMRNKPLGAAKGITLRKTRETVHRNAKCPCGCGKKFKRCEKFNEQRIIGVIVHREKSVETPDSAE